MRSCSQCQGNHPKSRMSNVQANWYDTGKMAAGQEDRTPSDVQVCHQRLSSAFDLFLIFLCSLIQTLTLTPPSNNALLANTPWLQKWLQFNHLMWSSTSGEDLATYASWSLVRLSHHVHGNTRQLVTNPADIYAQLVCHAWWNIKPAVCCSLRLTSRWWNIWLVVLLDVPYSLTKERPPPKKRPSPSLSDM